MLVVLQRHGDSGPQPRKTAVPRKRPEELLQNDRRAELLGAVQRLSDSILPHSPETAPGFVAGDALVYENAVSGWKSKFDGFGNRSKEPLRLLRSIGTLIQSKPLPTAWDPDFLAAAIGYEHPSFMHKPAVTSAMPLAPWLALEDDLNAIVKQSLATFPDGTFTTADEIIYCVEFRRRQDPDRGPVVFDPIRAQSQLRSVAPQLQDIIAVCVRNPHDIFHYGCVREDTAINIGFQLLGSYHRETLGAVEISVRQLQAALQTFGETIDLSKVNLNAVARDLARQSEGQQQVAGPVADNEPPPSSGVALPSTTSGETTTSGTDVEQYANQAIESPPPENLVRHVSWGKELFKHHVNSLAELRSALRQAVGIPCGNNLDDARDFATAVRRAAKRVNADLIYKGMRCGVYANERKQRKSDLKFDLQGLYGDEIHTSFTSFPRLSVRKRH